MSPTRMSRREVLRGLSFAAAGAALAACAAPEVIKEEVVVKETVIVEGEAVEVTKIVEVEIEKVVTPTPQPLEGKVIGYFGGWTPTESMERSEDNPTPHNMLLDVFDEYMAMNPGIEIEWIRLPSGIDSREWTVAQQMAGTVPHIMPAAQWVIKEDLEKNWWVNLSPYLEMPNPYIPADEPGGARWIDQFYPTPNQMTLLRGSRYNLCFGIVTTWFFYNVDLFDELGISVPESYYDFLENCRVAADAGLIGYDGQTWSVFDTDFWYRQQIGSMIMARDIEPLVNPDRGWATFDEVACALKNDVYNAYLPQFRQWMELWKMNVPYRRADWTVVPQDALRNFLLKETPIAEAGSWEIPRLETDPMMDFEWATFWAPPLTKRMSEYVTDPPTPAPNVGTVSDEYSITTRAMNDGVLNLAVDVLRFMSHPDNIGKVQGEIGTAMPNVKNVEIPERFAQAHKWVVESLGYVTMFQYESCTMDLEATERCVKAWWAYLLDEMTIDEAIEENDVAFKEYADRYIAQTDLVC